MKAKVIYKYESDHAREVLDYLRDFQRRTGRTLEEVDPESKDGIDTCRAYDIVQYPTIIALADDGHMLNMWVGTPLPTISEVSYYD